MQVLKKQQDEEEVFTGLPKWPVWVQTGGSPRFKVMRANVKKPSEAINHHR